MALNVKAKGQGYKWERDCRSHQSEIHHAFDRSERSENTGDLFLKGCGGRPVPKRSRRLEDIQCPNAHRITRQKKRGGNRRHVSGVTDKRFRWNVQTCLARLARLAGLEGYVKDLNGGVCHV